MSYFGEVEVSNPVELYLTWKGHEDDGFFVFWDKDKEENVKFELNEFIILKLGYVVKGYDEKAKKGIFSNEVQKTNKERFLVRYYDEEKTEVSEGFYTYIKDKVNAKGANLHRAITAYDIVSGKLVKFYLKGTSFYEFEKFLKTINRNTSKIAYKGKVVGVLFEGTRDEKKYQKPEFMQGGDITDNEMERAKELLGAIKQYDQMIEENYSNDTPDIAPGDVEDDVPFGSDEAPTTVAETAPDVAPEDDDLPF